DLLLKNLIGGVGTGATILGGIVLYLNFRTANKQAKIATNRLELETQKLDKESTLTKSRLIAERFSRAIEQLGSENIHVRLGGIYSLEQIARDSPEYHWTVMEVLTAFIRDKSPAKKHQEFEQKQSQKLTLAERYLPKRGENSKTSKISFYKDKITTDIQAALTVINRRELDKEDGTSRDKGELDLGSTLLSNADLSGAQLSKANLNCAELIGAKLLGANLREAKLTLTKLIGANLQKADLRKARLRLANFNGADLCEADFRDTDLRAARFFKSDLLRAKLNGTNLNGVDLRGGHLHQAHLNGADLNGADLSGAYLNGADLSGADLKEIKWEDANWEGVRGVCTARNVPDALKQELGLALPNQSPGTLAASDDNQQEPSAESNN
ncbi:MAG: pentapeptide repeat-containing protein, partial [Cyanobacteria bacterium J06633_23]